MMHSGTPTRRIRRPGPTLLSEESGTTSIEMVICLMILVTVWFGLAQLVLAGVGQIVVQHAAHRAARAAIVVLDDDPKHYEDAPRGQASQDSARLNAIRRAAYAPLSVLAPPLSTLNEVLKGNPTLEGAIQADLTSRVSGILYNKIAAAITLRKGHENAHSFEQNDLVTAHVAYLFHCRVPLVSSLLCKSFKSIFLDDDQANKVKEVESPRAQLLLMAGHFLILEAEETLPNQGAGYHQDEKDPSHAQP